VALLEQALAAVPADAASRAAILTDLSAAHAWLGEAVAREHWPLALAAADAALVFDPSSAAAAFNRALALERLGRLDEALGAWRALGAEGRAAGWRDEAVQRADALAAGRR